MQRAVVGAARWLAAQAEREVERRAASPGLRRLVSVGAGATIGAGVGLGIAALAVPAVLGAAGFASGGIAAGSLAAKMMSASAIASGGGVPAGGVVAILQSTGATGLSWCTTLGITATTASGGAAIGAAKSASK